MRIPGGFVVTIFLFAVIGSPCARAQQEIPLWPNGAPGMRHAHPETAEDKHETGRLDRYVGYVSQPTLTLYPSPAQAGPGPIVLVVPGGGFRYVCIDKEGIEVARWLNAQGIAAAVLKYRTLAPDGERNADTVGSLVSLGDTGRAMRLLRARAAEWKIDPNRISMIGFSAGAMMGIRLTNDATAGKPDAADPVERFSDRPNNIAIVYGALLENRAPKVDKSVPWFIVHGAADVKAPVAFAPKLFSNVLKDGGSAELHVYRGADHGFGIQPAAGTVREWPAAYLAWLRDIGMATPGK